MYFLYSAHYGNDHLQAQFSGQRFALASCENYMVSVNLSVSICYHVVEEITY